MKRDTGVATRGARFLPIRSCVQTPKYHASILFDTPPHTALLRRRRMRQASLKLLVSGFASTWGVLEPDVIPDRGDRAIARALQGRTGTRPTAGNRWRRRR